MLTAMVGPSGGTGGSPFKDPWLTEIAPQIIQIITYAGDWINSIQFEWAGRQGQVWGGNGQNGGTGGTLNSVQFQPGEYIKRLYGSYGEYVNCIFIQTNLSAYTLGGKRGGREFDYMAFPNQKIVGLWGCAGAYLDAVGVLIEG
jgi:hypothetical protein